MPEWLSYDKVQRGFNPAIGILNDVTNQLSLPSHIFDFSSRLYKKLVVMKLTSGRKREPLMGACIYISCLGTNYPIDFNRLCKILECEKKELIRQKKYIKRYVETNEEGITVESYINRYGYHLGLEQLEITQANKLTKITEQELMNQTVKVKAATCLYLVARNKVSIRQVTRVTGLSISALHSTIKKLNDKKPAIDLLICDKPLVFIEQKKRNII